MSEFENFNDPNIYLDFESTSMTTVSIVGNYIKLLETFHILFNKNIVTKKVHYTDFIYKQGMKCLNHIFILLLHYTNNLPFTYYHCEKGIYYFTEFISQIENENSFLKLSSIDAIIFVYKKTIYNINKKMAIQNAREFISSANESIKTITNINSISRYSAISSYFFKIANLSSDKLISLQRSVDDLENVKDIVQEFKKVL
tara:strand:+ start:4751 stop:5350 length:600 start_codon:yes stop_codon:yes gene_type:complete